MQLFITPYEFHGDHIALTEDRVLHQLSRVLRAKEGDNVSLQWGYKRIRCEISSIEKKKILVSVINEEEKKFIDDEKFLGVALPNKFEKLELIVQKCAEVGIQHIVLFPSRRSVLTEISDSKNERLQKILLEAVEQSWGWNIPEVIFVKDIFTFCKEKKVFVAHQEGKNVFDSLQNIDKEKKQKASIMLVGPEGGRHSDEEKAFLEGGFEKISFGNTVLRTETAAIIASRMIKNAG